MIILLKGRLLFSLQLGQLGGRAIEGTVFLFSLQLDDHSIE